jgi:phage shock protein PspC (stress-responsive transcriptional regulator)
MKKLYRSSRDRKLTGLCGGLAEVLNVDPTLLRLVVALAAFFSGGVIIPLYIIASLVIPKEPDQMFSPGWSGYSSSMQSGEFWGHKSGGGWGHTGGGWGTMGEHAPSMDGPAVSQEAAGMPPKDSHLDEMMKDLEKKALEKEIEALRAKLKEYEKKTKTSIQSNTKEGDQ